MDTPTYTAPGGSAQYPMSDGTHVVLADATATGGAYEVFEITAPRAPAVPQHTSPWTGTMHVVEGTVRVHVADEHQDLGPGATFTIPGDVAFTFEVTSESAHLLGVTSGDGAGRFFADLAASVPVDAPIEEALPAMMAVTARHGVRVEVPQPAG